MLRESEIRHIFLHRKTFSKTYFSHLQQSQKIEDLTDQLNQSMLTISGLQTQMKNLSKIQKEIEKNYSSLLLTARAEINRKNENINQLRQS